MRRLWLSLGLLAFASSACVNLCGRRDRFFESHCKGTNVAYGGDPIWCESNLDNCSTAQLKEFEAYVMCLEELKECSFESTARCAQSYSGGVNLMCAKKG